MTERLQAFVTLSAALTGLSPVRLAGTGQAAAYLAEVDAILPAGLLDDLLDRFAALPPEPDRNAALAEQILAEQILADERLGPVARSLILLWYRGAWTQLPDEWRARFGVSERDTNRVVSAEAYQAGQQWVVAGAHPAGALQQGYGAWTLPPVDGGQS